MKNLLDTILPPQYNSVIVTFILFRGAKHGRFFVWFLPVNWGKKEMYIEANLFPLEASTNMFELTMKSPLLKSGGVL